MMEMMVKINTEYGNNDIDIDHWGSNDDDKDNNYDDNDDDDEDSNYDVDNDSQFILTIKLPPPITTSPL